MISARHGFLVSAVLLIAGLLCCACGKKGSMPDDLGSGGADSGTENPDPVTPPAPEDKYGLAYLFGDETVMPEVHVSVTEAEWNRLLGMFDANSRTKQYIECNVDVVVGEEHNIIGKAGLRLRGNTSRRRPMDQWGGFHHAHFGLNFRKYVKDSDHQVHGCRKVNLKWFKDDATYTREMYCYDLFRRAGVWTAINTSYCRLWLNVGGKEIYYGVYEMQEAIDSRYLKARGGQFGGATGGNLWKCRFGANLKNQGQSFGLDDGSDAEFTYECKSDDNDYAAAEDQLRDFMLKLNGKSDQSFYTWINQVCDVPLLLKTYAVNVVCGMWDDYWCNTNNYYLYFDSTDKFNYKFYFIPYDYDNTLGTSLMIDSGRQDPLHWGSDNNPLITRLLCFEDFRAIYVAELKRLVGKDAGLFYYTGSMERIKRWQNMVAPYVNNATGEDCTISDVPASWGNHPEYRIMTTGPNNFFQVKTDVIEAM